jgi:hypothetical protein
MAAPIFRLSFEPPKIYITMSRPQVNFDIVRDIGLKLPDVEDGTVYGSPALKVRGSLLTCLAIHKSAEPGTLAVRICFDHVLGC